MFIIYVHYAYEIYICYQLAFKKYEWAHDCPRLIAEVEVKDLAHRRPRLRLRALQYKAQSLRAPLRAVSADALVAQLERAFVHA